MELFPIVGSYLQEIIPDPTPESIARDAEMEAQVFAQAGNVDRLLSMLSAADAQGSSISEDDDLMVCLLLGCLVESFGPLILCCLAGIVPSMYPFATQDSQIA